MTSTSKPASNRTAFSPLPLTSLVAAGSLAACTYRRTYRVFSLGVHTAEAEEGSPGVHHRYKYDWTDGGVVALPR